MNAPPLKRIEFLVLAVLQDEPLHGYGIVKEILRITGGAVQVRPGSLYRVLDRMMGRGLLVRCDSAPVDDEADDRRTNYRITEAGRAAARAEAGLLTSIAAHVMAAPGAPGGAL